MKKILSLLICIVFISGVFSSCKSNEKEASSTIYDLITYTYDSAYSFDDATIRAYKDLCDAVVNGKSEVRMNAGMLDNVLQLYYTSFPLNFIVESIEPTESVFTIKYKSDNHSEDVRNFIEKKYDIRTHCNNENDAVFAIKLYSYIASSIKPSSKSEISCYETLLTGEGTSFSYSNLFEYILQQRGIKAYHILCEGKNGESRAISAAVLGEKMYYFDLFSEYEDNSGELLKYFGMTTKEAESNGIRNMIYTNRLPAEKAYDGKYKALRKCTSWNVDDNMLSVTDENGKIVQVAL